jgi:hypothetical protein
VHREEDDDDDNVDDGGGTNAKGRSTIEVVRKA